MARSMWSGAITFGLVNVPVKMFTAVSPKSVHFHQMRSSDGARIEYKRVAATDKKEVPYNEIVKGYEVSPNQYVTLQPKELESLDPDKSSQIQIEKFVDLEQIDPIYFENAYYLAPDKNAGKAYALLQHAMTDTGKVAVAKMVMHNKEHVVALRSMGHAIGLFTLYFNDEIVSEEHLELPAAADKPHEKELSMAKQLIDSISGDFDPEEYHDDYRKRVLDLIHQKAEGKDIVVQAAPKTASHNVVNLMEALKASIENSAKKAKPLTAAKTADIARRASRHKPKTKRTA